MKKIYAAVLVLSACIVTSFVCLHSSTKKITKINADNGFAVIELFTSEGCSSCPPADDAVAHLLKEYKDNVYVLGYHVDYWNNLGWKDAFSSAAYSQRQQNYARVFKLSSIYTPQVVVNGDEQFVGSDNSRLHNAVNKDLKEVSAVNISVTSTQSNNDIKVDYSTNATADINIALVQKAATSQVRAGENNGALLHHVNVVRVLKTLPSTGLEGSVLLPLPAGLTAKDCEVIAFIQDDKNLKILSAAKSEIQ